MVVFFVKNVYTCEKKIFLQIKNPKQNTIIFVFVCLEIKILFMVRYNSWILTKLKRNNIFVIYKQMYIY